MKIKIEIKTVLYFDWNFKSNQIYITNNSYSYFYFAAELCISSQFLNHVYGI